MSLRDAIAGNKSYPRRFGEYVVWFTLRNPKSQEALEFRQKLSRVNFKNGRTSQTQEAATASLWYFEKLLVKKEYTNGSDEREPLPEEDYNELTDDAKMDILEEHLAAIRGDSVEVRKN